MEEFISAFAEYMKAADETDKAKTNLERLAGEFITLGNMVFDMIPDDATAGQIRDAMHAGAELAGFTQEDRVWSILDTAMDLADLNDVIDASSLN